MNPENNSIENDLYEGYDNIDFKFINNRFKVYNFYSEEITIENNLIKKFITWLKIIPKQISDQIIIESENHKTTKYHNENLLTHLVLTGLLCNHLVIKENLTIDPELAFWCGVLHDIGKPFCKVNKKKKIYYTGHSQIGDYLITNLSIFDISDTDKEILSWCINNHMCCLSHNKDYNLYMNNNKYLIELIHLSIRVNPMPFFKVQIY